MIEVLVINKSPFTNIYKYVRDECNRLRARISEVLWFSGCIPELLIPINEKVRFLVKAIAPVLLMEAAGFGLLTVSLCNLIIIFW